MENACEPRQRQLICCADCSSGTLEVFEESGSRWLQYSRGAVQSRMELAAPTSLALPYTRAMMVALLFLERPAKALLLGLGGGSLVRFLRHHLAGLDITAIESDEVVISVAREFFAIPDDGADFRIIRADARALIEEPELTVDLVLADLFDEQGLPQWMYEPAFHRACRERLSNHGVLVTNLWLEAEDEFLHVMGGIRDAFEARTLIVTVEGFHNLVVLAFQSQPECLDFETLYRRAATLGNRTGIDFAGMLTGMRETNLIDDRGFVV